MRCEVGAELRHGLGAVAFVVEAHDVLAHLLIARPVLAELADQPGFVGRGGMGQRILQPGHHGLLELEHRLEMLLGLPGV